MLAKCAESCALRKAFPQELSGLYTADEMAQASNEDEAKRGYTVKAPEAVVEALEAGSEPVDAAQVPREHSGISFVNGDQRDEVPAEADAIPPGMVKIRELQVRPTANKSVKKHIVVLSDGRTYLCVK